MPKMSQYEELRNAVVQNLVSKGVKEHVARECLTTIMDSFPVNDSIKQWKARLVEIGYALVDSVNALAEDPM